MELKTIKEIVIKLLEENEALRGDDDLLYLEVLKKNYINVHNTSLQEFFTNRKRKGLPSFESIRRSRQKAQEENPALKPCEEIQKGREKQREKFYDFSRLKQQSLF